MRRALPLISAGLVAFLLTLLAVLPASLFVPLLPATITLGGTTGTIWNGSTDAITVSGRPLGGLRWRFRPLQLFRGRFGIDGELIRSDGNARGRLAIGMGGRLQARDVEANLPLSALTGIAPPGWGGNIQAHLGELDLASGSVPKIEGTIEAHGLQAPPPGGAAIGSYVVSFDPKGTQNDKLIGQLKDLEGPMQVSGTITLAADRSYVVEGLVAPRTGASQSVTDTLRFLGTPDSQGRRPFSIAGTY